MNNGKTKTGVGAVLVGAALGAAAVTLMNKSSRKNVKEKIKKALDDGDSKLDKLQDRAKNLKTKAKEKAVKELKKTEKKLTANV